jgi:cyclophilin family peptidyl-prolyl cis-trans isomerase
MKYLVIGMACWIGCASGVLADTLAYFNTPMGQMLVGLYDKAKPVTTQNFVRYVQSGAYSNMFLHRCMPGFVVQGGGFTVADPTSYGAFAAYYVPVFGKITNEFGVGPKYSNTYGTLAMAKVANDPNSATSQWFFNLANNAANLDNQNGGYTVFGRVLLGTNVLEAFNALSYGGGGVVDLSYFYGSDFAVFSTLPVTYQGLVPPTIRDLMFADISLLTVQVGIVDGQSQITWNSASNKVNTVEFATNTPPSWQVLTSVTGTGGTMSVTDSAPISGVRAYRVRVNF